VAWWVVDEKLTDQQFERSRGAAEARKQLTMDCGRDGGGDCYDSEEEHTKSSGAIKE
jgi:hypothetical protein